MNNTGKVYLVGAGPGDPGLITVKGLDCIKRADVIIYDFLASPALLKHARPEAEIIYVGKKGGDHTLPQDQINQLIAVKAAAGLMVTRLKGGDPFIFGRGGEEAEVLVEHGIPFEIVPGVTSAIAAPAYSGIPLTHRKFTSTVAFITGHEDPLKETSSIDWAALAQGIGTMVFLMGIKNLPHIVGKLMEHGLAPETPAAVVRWGTTPRQQTVSGTLQTIQGQVQAAGITAPAVVIVGKVVTLRETLKWYESKPLLGKTIVVTRAREQASQLVAQLADAGAECIEYPTIQIVPPDDMQPLEQAVNNIAKFDWLIFTSVNGVERFFERLDACGLDTRALGKIKTAAIGPATAAKMLTFGLKTDILPDSYQAEAVIAAFEAQPMVGKKVLIPRALEARPILPEKLVEMGAEVTEVAAYRTIPATDNAERLLEQLSAKSIDIITFASSSTVANFRRLLPADDAAAQVLMQGVTVASIGPITTETAQQLGFTVAVSAPVFTIPGLCQAIIEYYGQHPADANEQGTAA